MRFCHPWGKWFVWDRCRWRDDDTGEAIRRAKQTVAQMYAEANERVQLLNGSMTSETPAEDSLRQQLEAAQADRNWALKSEMAPRINAMLEMARSEPGIPVVPDDLDRDVWLFNVCNGTLDLRTGDLRQHRRQDNLTRLCAIDYQPDATCPLWEGFLARIFKENQELIVFMQRLLGRCLSGDVSEQILPIFWGEGSNGKSVLVSVMASVLGSDYALKGNTDLLTEHRSERHPTELAQLFGKRLVVCSETSQRRRLNEALVKDLTGGERVLARRMREDFWEFSPTHKVFLLTNHKPIVVGTDHGIWRRLRLVPFEVKFWDPADPANKKRRDLPKELKADKQLLAKLEAERKGILAWLVRGCLGWQKDGLTVPAKVVEATNAYRNAEDLLGHFIEERCHVDTADPNAKCRASVLFDAYCAWCEVNREKEMSQRAFGEAMTLRGFERGTSNGTWYHGIILQPQAISRGNQQEDVFEAEG